MRHQLLCGPYAPVGINGNKYNGGSPGCHNFTLSTDLISSDNPDLIHGLPVIFPNGSLVADIAPQQIGTATYRATLIHDSMREDVLYRSVTPHDFRIRVVQPNLTPSFDTINVIVNASTAYTEVKFAENLSAGVGEDYQELSFDFVFSNCSRFFDIAPSLVVRVDEDGKRIGVLGYSLKVSVSGDCNFTVVLVDNGGSDEAIGAFNTSIQRFFKMTVLGNNKQPTFDVKPSITLNQNSQSQNIDFVVTNKYTGGAGEEDQTLALFITKVKALNGDLSEVEAFEELEVFQNGTIRIKPAVNVFGLFIVELMLQDDGGTDNGGNDKAYRNLAVDILVGEIVLAMESIADQLNITENTGYGNIFDENYTFPSVFSLVGQELDTRLKGADYQILNVTNPEMFTKGTPKITSDGAVVVSVSRKSKFYESLIFVQATHFAVFTPTLLLRSNTLSVKVKIFLVNDPPTFEVLPVLKTIQGMGLQQIPRFANYSVGPPDEFWQVISFAVRMQSDLTRLFMVHPRIDTNGKRFRRSSNAFRIIFFAQADV
jgi:hypothetical protein